MGSRPLIPSIPAFSHLIELAMNSPSPSKPKWTPGGAIRRTSTLLSMGRSKTPSRSSTIHESNSSPSKGVAAKGATAKGAAAVAPTSPAPKPVPPKSPLSTGPPSQEPTATPSKSTLARMGTALRRPSSLIPRRRTTSTASSFRDGDSTPSKVASAIRSSSELEPATKSNPTAEPATLQAPESTVPEPQSSVSESEQALSPVIESSKTQSADKPEEAPSRDIVEHSDLSSSRESTTKEALDEPLELSAAIVSELAPILLLAEQFNAEPEVVQPSILPPVSRAAPVSEQPPAQLEDKKSSLAPTLEPASGQPNAQLEETTKLSPVPISAPEPAREHVDAHIEAQASSPAPLSTSEPPSEQIRAHLEVEEPSMEPRSASEPVLASLVTDAMAPSLVTEEQSTVFISEKKEAVPPSPIPPTQSVPEVIQDVTPSASSATHDAIVEAPPVVTSRLPIMEAGIAPSIPEPDHVAEPLREVSSLNSSFEDLALSTQPVEDEIVVVQKDVVVDHPSVLLTPAGVASVPIETAEKEKVSPVAVVPAPQEPSSIKSTVPILEITKESEAEAPVVPALHVTQEPRRSLPLEIPTTSAESAAPSPAATHPLLPLEVQEFPPRQINGPLGPVRDHHTKTPQEYKSMLRMLFDGLVGLIRHWRRCLW
ncbi:hypothetical protein C0993_010569 [Termitomyces sp. T159_Od127]|nr:hypothetical protein C0993_010569 [Termitomyces sp. T159_Od127]